MNSQPESSQKKESPNKIRNERGKITTDTTEIQRIIREYHNDMSTNQTSQKKKDKFPETYNLPRLSHVENRKPEQTKYY